MSHPNDISAGASHFWSWQTSSDHASKAPGWFTSVTRFWAAS